MQHWTRLQPAKLCVLDGNRRGAAIVLAMLVLLLMFAMLAFATDIGYLMMMKSDAYTAVDAGALAAASNLSQGRASATTSMNEYLTYNGIDPAKIASANRGQVTIEFGAWDSDKRDFQVKADDKEVNAVRVTSVLTQVDSFFGRVANRNSYSIRASSIAVKSAPLDIMMVVDLSGSMSTHGRIAALHHAAPKFVDAIESIGSGHQIGVMGFSADPAKYNPAAKGHTGQLYQPSGLVQPSGAEVAVVEHALTADFSKLRNTVLASSNLPADKYKGGTGTGAAIRDATHFLTNHSSMRSTATKLIVLMSDGLATSPSGSAESYALEQAALAKSSNVAVHTVSLGSDADKDLLKSIAAAANGSYFDAAGESAEQLKEALTKAFDKIAGAAAHSIIVR